MPFFPFSTENVTFGLWRYSAAAGAYGDGAAYYSGPGALWDLGWLLLTLLFAWSALTATYFREVIVPADAAAWEWLRRTLRVRDDGLLLIYRGTFFYGLGRMVAWFIHARFNTTLPFEVVWGGPRFVQGADLSDAGLGELAVRTAVGGSLFVGFSRPGLARVRSVTCGSGAAPSRTGRPGATSALAASRGGRIVSMQSPSRKRVRAPAVRPGVEGRVPRHHAMRSSSIPSITVTSAGSCWRSGRATETCRRPSPDRCAAEWRQCSGS